MSAGGWGLAGRGLEGLLALILLALVGYPLALLIEGRRQDAEATLAGCFGCGIAVVVCSWWVTGLLDLPAWPLLLALSGLALGLLGVRHGRAIVPHALLRSFLATWPLLLFAAALLTWRLVQVQGLVFPAWVDSVHHATVIRKMSETWTVPRDLAPYLPMPFFYHFGYHALTVSLMAAARLSIPEGMIVMGQALQVVAALSIYRLARALFAKRLWAWMAAILVACVAALPAYYTAWGKYPLLTAVATWSLAQSYTLEMLRRGGSWRQAIGLGALIAGTILAHTFSGLLLGITTVLSLAHHMLLGQTGGRAARVHASWVGIGLGFALLWTAPWIARVWSYTGRFVGVQGGGEMLRAEAVRAPGYLSYLWELTGPASNRLLLGLALPGVVLALRERSRRDPALWFLAVLFLSVPWGWLPGPWSPDQVLIVLWLPAVPLATEAMCSAWHALSRVRYSLLLSRATLCAVALWLACGLWAARQPVSEDTILATSADAHALAWVRDNLPRDARFYIAVAPWPPYGYRGADGGWWLLPYTGRQALLPPAIWGLGDSRQVELTNELAAHAAATGGCGPGFWELVQRAHLDYLYLNARHGPLHPQGFEGCEALERVYAREGVYIYHLLWPPKSSSQ